MVKNLKNGIVINLLGMGATLLGMQATVGVLVAKALTSSAQPFLQGQGYSPVLALDVFVVQVRSSRTLFGSIIQYCLSSSHPALSFNKKNSAQLSGTLILNVGASGMHAFSLGPSRNSGGHEFLTSPSSYRRFCLSETRDFLPASC